MSQQVSRRTFLKTAVAAAGTARALSFARAGRGAAAPAAQPPTAAIELTVDLEAVRHPLRKKTP